MFDITDIRWPELADIPDIPGSFPISDPHFPLRRRHPVSSTASIPSWANREAAKAMRLSKTAWKYISLEWNFWATSEAKFWHWRDKCNCHDSWNFHLARSFRSFRTVCFTPKTAVGFPKRAGHLEKINPINLIFYLYQVQRHVCHVSTSQKVVTKNVQVFSWLNIRFEPTSHDTTKHDPKGLNFWKWGSLMVFFLGKQWRHQFTNNKTT